MKIIGKSNLLFMMCFCLIISCNTGCDIISTDKFLNGDFIEADKTPPGIIAPADGSVTEMEVVLEWENRIGAREYILTIGSNRELTENAVTEILTDNIYTFTATESKTCYWKVVSDITEGEVTVQSFNPLDAIYVWGGSSSVEVPLGTKERPFKKIANALRAGKAYGKDLRVASVPEGYNESFSMVAGVSLYGGYSAFDGWSSRDFTANQTIINLDDPDGIKCTLIFSDTVIDGFTINGSPHNTTLVFNVISSGSRLIISNNIINAAASTGNADSVFNIGSCGVQSKGSSVTIEGNKIYGGTTASDDTNSISCGIVNLNYSSTVISNNIIEGADQISDDGSCGIYNETSSSPLLRNNIIRGGETKKGYSYGIYARNQCAPVISENEIYSGATTGTGTGEGFTCGIFLSNDNAQNSILKITDNTVIGGNTMGGHSFGITLRLLNSSNKSVISGNIIRSGNTTGSGISGGIQCDDRTSPIISRNIISGNGSVNGNSIGVYNRDNSSPVIALNVVSGGDATGNGKSCGIYNYLSSSPVIVSNTVYSKSVIEIPDLASSSIINLSSSKPGIINNIIFTVSNEYRYCIYAEDIDSAPSELRSNLIFNPDTTDPSYLYRRSSTARYNDSSVENVDVLLASVSSIVSGNLTYPDPAGVDITSIFNDPYGNITPGDPWDDFQLKPGNKAISNGVNLYNDSVYGNIITDILGNARTESGNWNIGAY